MRNDITRRICVVVGFSLIIVGLAGLMIGKPPFEVVVVMLFGVNFVFMGTQD